MKMTRHFVSQTKIAHRMAIDCLALATAEGFPVGAIMVAEDPHSGGWIMRAFETEDEAVDAAGDVSTYTNVYSQPEVAMFISDPGQWTDAEKEI